MINPNFLKPFVRTATFVLLALTSTVQASDNLGSILTQTGWEKIIGTWIDPETKGKHNRTTFSWKYEGTVLESITQMPNKETISLFGRNAKTGNVFVASADSLGGSSQGEVKFTKGLATFQISFAADTGQSGDLEIKYTLIDSDTMEVTFVMEKPMTIKLVRE